MNNYQKCNVIVIFLLISSAVMADDNDDAFEEYLDTLCNTSPFDPIFQGWLPADFQNLTNNVCQVYLPSGGIVSSADYQSASNIGSTGATAQSSGHTAQQQVDSIKDRLAEIEEESEIIEGGWGLLVSGQVGDSTRVDTVNQNGFDSDLAGFLIGGDYRFTNAFILGVAIGLTEDDATFAMNTGTLETSSLSTTLYFTYAPSRQLFIDGYVGVTDIDFDSERRVDFQGDTANNVNVMGSSTAQYKGSQTLAGFSAGYQFYFGDVAVSPYFALDLIDTDVDAHQESGNTGLEFRYAEQKTNSQQESLGINISASYEHSWGFLVPSIDIAAIHESKDDSKEFEAILTLFPGQSPTPGFLLVSDDPDREFGLVRLGLAAALHGGMQIFASYEQNFSHDLIETRAITFGIVSEF